MRKEHKNIKVEKKNLSDNTVFQVKVLCYVDIGLRREIRKKKKTRMPYCSVLTCPYNKGAKDSSVRYFAYEFIN